MEYEDQIVIRAFYSVKWLDWAGKLDSIRRCIPELLNFE